MISVENGIVHINASRSLAKAELAGLMRALQEDNFLTEDDILRALEDSKKTEKEIHEEFMSKLCEIFSKIMGEESK